MISEIHKQDRAGNFEQGITQGRVESESWIQVWVIQQAGWVRVANGLKPVYLFTLVKID